jgi:hypothetical protein
VCGVSELMGFPGPEWRIGAFGCIFPMIMAISKSTPVASWSRRVVDYELESFGAMSSRTDRS